MRSIFIPRSIKKNLASYKDLASRIREIKARVDKLAVGFPEVSIVIPAFNEEMTILQTLASLSESITHRSIEIIVVNNNSVDRTEELATAAGVLCVREQEQGYMYARNKGLSVARGKYILNADADTLYPSNWIEEMIVPLEKSNDTALVYGRYSFFSISGRPRLSYFFYEVFSDIVRQQAKKVKDEAAFVMGANSGFLRIQALSTGGYSHPPGANEDGYLALKLKKYGKLKFVKDSIVWTSDRSLVAEGSLVSSSFVRLRKYVRRLGLS